jgi:hypothetical protein
MIYTKSWSEKWIGHWEDGIKICLKRNRISVHEVVFQVAQVGFSSTFVNAIINPLVQ